MLLSTENLMLLTLWKYVMEILTENELKPGAFLLESAPWGGGRDYRVGEGRYNKLEASKYSAVSN